MDCKTKNVKGHLPSITNTGTVGVWPMAYHKNRVRRSSAFASGRYSSLVPAVLEQHEQKTLDARDEKERRKRKKQRAAERVNVEELMKQIQSLQEQQAVMAIEPYKKRDDTPESSYEMQDYRISMMGNHIEKDAQDIIKYIVDELDKLKVSLEEVRDMVVMKTSRRHMEWAFHSSRFASAIHGTWNDSDINKSKSPRSGYSERMLQSSTFHALYGNFPTSDEKSNIVELSDDELAHSTTIFAIK
ncbi:uncharacterized protein [Antedon mediterranea]|uniref:uncharacterized protein isoform X2 n=1 Tax=Antedon mediterranea TaxID=105859 RepID=UPI003AFA006D